MGKKVLIVGAGNIGSRHLQGLAGLSHEVEISVIDPLQDSLDMSKERWLQTGAPHQVSFYRRLPDDLKHVDCAILSCSSDIRADVARMLLAKLDITAMIFEKVLFQKIEDYISIDSLLKQKGVLAWVNCVRRTWPVYREFHDTLRSHAPVHLEVSGSNWGLGCNSIHMIDCLSYMSGETEFEITETRLDSDIIDSKRRGFCEFTGEFRGQFKDGSTFRISSSSTADIPYRLSLKSGEKSIIVHEDSDHYDEFSDEVWSSKKLVVPLQSQLSGLIVKDILDNGRSDLTPFSDSVALHVPFIEMLLGHYNRVRNEKSDTCPVT